MNTKINHKVSKAQHENEPMMIDERPNNNFENFLLTPMTHV